MFPSKMCTLAEVHAQPKRVSFDGELRNNHPIHIPCNPNRINSRIGTPPRRPTQNSSPGVSGIPRSTLNINARSLYMKILSIETELYEAEEQIERTRRSVRSLHHVLNNLSTRRNVPTNLGMKMNIPKNPGRVPEKVGPDVIVDISQNDTKEVVLKKDNKSTKITAEERAKKCRRRLFLTPLFIFLVVFFTLLVIWSILYSYLNFPSFYRDVGRVFNIFGYILFYGM